MAGDFVTISIVYVSEHGSPPANQSNITTIGSGSVFNLDSQYWPSLTDNDYIFMGWYTTATFDEGTKFEGEYDYPSVIVNRTLTLYAKWKPNGYTITYHNKYGTTPEPVTTSDKTYTGSMLPVLSYPYANFLGWYTTETFDENTLISIGDAISSDVTLYAKWEPTERHRVNPEVIYSLADAIRKLEGSTGTMGIKEIADRIRALGGGSLITFTIGDTSYQAEDGMTWGEWLLSSYNNGEYTADGDYVRKTILGETYNKYSWVAISELNDTVRTEDRIESKTAYIITKSSIKPAPPPA